MRVEVIISILNGEEYIEESVLSIINQTYSNWHLVLIDNASTDNTLELLRKLQSIAPEKITIKHFDENIKPSYRWMQVISISTADVFAISCHDDAWEHDKLAKQIEMMQNSNADIIHTNIKVIDTYGNEIKNAANTENSYRNALKYDSLKPIELAKEFAVSNSIRLSSVLIKNTVFQKYGGWEPGIWGGEDWGLWVKFAAEGCKFCHLEAPLTIRRVHCKNASSSSGYDRSFGFIKAIKIIEEKYPFLSNRLLLKKDIVYKRIILLSIKNKQYSVAKEYSKYIKSKKKKNKQDILYLLLSYSGFIGKLVLKIKSVIYKKC